MIGCDIEEILEISPQCDERFIDQQSVPELADLHIGVSGVSTLQEHYKVGRKNPMHHALLFSVAGEIEVTTESGICKVAHGQLIYFPAGQPFLMQLKSKMWRKVWFELDDNSVWRRYLANQPLVVDCRQTHQLYHLLSLLYYEKSVELRRPLVKQLDGYIKQSLKVEHTSNADEQRLTQVIDQLEAKLHYPWTVDDMAQLANYSAPHLHRLFQKQFARSPLQQLIEMRMQKAKYLLANTNWSSEQIAEQVGYADVFNFAKRFKKSVGLAPGQYRKSNKSA
ncbi:response regulator receiver domain-containing protein [Catenovulum agarivorans DS-2]|uniref:Response regulator receiver domain-containing protein n=1 Tax=Catenovulum agarivorans DS-2 TaxID=1328313 RepID=W7QFR3_9ALTE|nr:AraC family transcriptional regulator [Catenovulum agarivorans]EWH11759.1 response regulator receiver domain-containing protein [Catenovulum agarivorans DS-2]